MTWKEYKFLTLNDLSDYESEINFLAGKKDIYVYSGSINMANPRENPDEEDAFTIFNVDGTTNQYKCNELDNYSFSEDLTNKKYSKIVMSPFGEPITEENTYAIYNCSEVTDDPNTTEFFDISGNNNHTTGTVKREIESIVKTWQPYIDRAKERVKYELTNLFNRNGLTIDDLVDKIQNKDYFSTAIAYLTLSMIYNDLSVSSNQDTVYSNKSISYSNKYKEFFGMIVNLIRIDTNDDGVTDYKPKVSFGTLVI